LTLNEHAKANACPEIAGRSGNENVLRNAGGRVKCGMKFAASGSLNVSLARIEVYAEIVCEAWRTKERRGSRQALAVLDSPGVPASSCPNTEPYRSEIRRSAQKTLKQLSAAH
jgi:hypothetical protein